MIVLPYCQQTRRALVVESMCEQGVDKHLGEEELMWDEATYHFLRVAHQLYFTESGVDFLHAVALLP